MIFPVLDDCRGGSDAKFLFPKVLDLSVKKPWANCWVTGIGRTSGSQEVSRQMQGEENRVCHTSEGEKVISHMRSGTEWPHRPFLQADSWGWLAGTRYNWATKVNGRWRGAELRILIRAQFSRQEIIQQLCQKASWNWDKTCRYFCAPKMRKEGFYQINYIAFKGLCCFPVIGRKEYVHFNIK